MNGVCVCSLGNGPAFTAYAPKLYNRKQTEKRKNEKFRFTQVVGIAFLQTETQNVARWLSSPLLPLILYTRFAKIRNPFTLSTNVFFNQNPSPQTRSATGNETKWQNCAESSHIINHGPAHRLYGDDFSVVQRVNVLCSAHATGYTLLNFNSRTKMMSLYTLNHLCLLSSDVRCANIHWSGITQCNELLQKTPHRSVKNH